MEPAVFVNSPIAQLNNVSNFKILLEGLLSNSSSTRTECLEFFDQLKQTHLSFLLEALSEILFYLTDPQTKILTLLIIRQIFTNKSPQDLWTLCSIDLRKKLCQTFLSYSKSESSLSVLKSLSYVLTNFNQSIHSFSKRILPEFLEASIDYCSTEAPCTYLGLYVLSGYFSYFNDYFYLEKESLFKIFERFLKTQDLDVKTAAVYAFAALVFSVENSQVMYFSQLLKPVLKALIQITSEEVFEKISEAAEAEPFFFFKKIGLCHEFCKVILNSNKSVRIKFIVCKFISGICSNSPECRKQQIVESVNLIRRFICLFTFQIPDSVEIDYLDLGSELISEIISNHLDFAQDFVSEICESVLLNGLKFYILGVLQLEKVIKLLRNRVTQISEMLIQTNDEYSQLLTLKCIGNLWKFSKYSLLNLDHVFSINISALSSTSKSIQTQACKSLSYFLERGTKSNVLKFSQPILNHLFQSITPTTQKENLSLLLKLLKRCKDSMVFHEIPENLMKVLNSENSYQVLTCLTELKTLYPVENLIQEVLLSLNLTQNPLEPKTLMVWQLILKKFPTTAEIYAEQLFSPMITLVSESLVQSKNLPEVYLQSLIYFASCEACFRFLPQVNWIAARLFEHMDEDVQSFGSQLAVTILKNMKRHRDKAAFELAKIYTKSIWKSFILHTQTHHKLEQLEALKALMETFDESFLTEAEAGWLINSLFDCLKNSSGFEIMVEECRFAAFVYRKHLSLNSKLLEIAIDVLTGYLQISSKDEKFVILTVLCEFLDNCGSIIGERIEKIIEYLFLYSTEEDEKIREQALKGIGSYSVVINKKEFVKVLDRVLDVLEKSIANEAEYNHRYYNKCRNTAILTVGIIMLHHSESLDLKKMVQGWIWLLPLHDDPIKAKKSEAILSELLKRHSFTLGNLGEKNIGHIKDILKQSYSIDISTSIEHTFNSIIQ